MSNYPYIIIDAPGFYGAEGRVYSRHRSFRAALRQTGRGLIVARNPEHRYKAGDTFWADMPPERVRAPVPAE